MPPQTVLFPGLDAVRQAEARIRPFIRETALERAYTLESELGTVWFKLENQQLTGSFKMRGATNKILNLSEIERSFGIVTASSGNHALAIAYAAEQHGVAATIFLPESVEPGKLELLARLGIETRQFGKECGETEVYAKEQAEKSGRIFVSAYNDREIIAGQGTIGFELWKQLPDIDTVFVPVGGGGLIAGIGSYLKSVKPDIEIVAVSPINSPALMDELLGTDKEHRTWKETISDGTAGSIDTKSITIDLCRAVVDEWILVEDQEIEICMRLLFDEYRLITEGSGALTVAAYIKESTRFENKNCALIVSGGNVTMPEFRSIIRA